LVGVILETRRWVEGLPLFLRTRSLLAPGHPAPLALSAEAAPAPALCGLDASSCCCGVRTSHPTLHLSPFPPHTNQPSQIPTSATKYPGPQTTKPHTSTAQSLAAPKKQILSYNPPPGVTRAHAPRAPHTDKITHHEYGEPPPPPRPSNTAHTIRTASPTSLFSHLLTVKLTQFAPPPPTR
jgi:hypothetical protein